MTDSLSAGADDLRADPKTFNEAVGRELRNARERKRLSRKALAGPWGPAPRTLLFYEAGRWEVPILRFADLCLRLDQDPSELLMRALQRAGIAHDKVTLEVDLLALLRDEFDPLFLHPWAKGKLADCGRRIVRLSPEDVQQLSTPFHPHATVARHLAQFLPADTI